MANVFDRIQRHCAWLSGVVQLVACGSSHVIGTGNTTTGGHSSTDIVVDGGTQITIHDFVYSPANIGVAAGATVTVINQDVEPHSVTSEAMLNDYVPGAVNGVQFDTGVLAVGASAQFTITPGAVSGTVVPYYCTVHKLTMMQGTLSVQ